MLCVTADAAYAQKIKPEEIIAKHLDSVAASDVRAATKTIVAVGSGTRALYLDGRRTGAGPDRLCV